MPPSPDKKTPRSSARTTARRKAPSGTPALVVTSESISLSDAGSFATTVKRKPRPGRSAKKRASTSLTEATGDLKTLAVSPNGQLPAVPDLPMAGKPSEVVQLPATHPSASADSLGDLPVVGLPNAGGQRERKRMRGRRGRGRGREKKAATPAMVSQDIADPLTEVDFRTRGNGNVLTGATQEEVADSSAEQLAETEGETPPGLERAPGRRGRRGRRGRNRAGAETSSAPAAAVPQPFPDDTVEEAPEEITPDEFDEDAVVSADGAVRDMVINVSAGDECRIAVLHEGRLEELFIERTATQSHVGNIYKGRVTNVEPSIQAVFVDFGLTKNGFLHISDVQPQYFPDHQGAAEDVGRKIPRHHRPPIQRCFRRGQELIVQIIKEGVGTKGPTLTTYLSIPGRFLVMMPGMSEIGVSRKIEDEVTRRKMREMLNELDLPTGIGFILRTAGLGRNKRELQRDLHYLQRLWKTVVDRVKQLPAPAELYRESDLVIRTIRDVYSAEFKRLVVDDPETADKARAFLQIAMPRSRAVVELYRDREPIFHRFGIEAEIERINMRHVPLPSGGSLVIDTTEAMVTIDVNSGKFRSLTDAEETAYRINIEAAGEIARQLRLRDLGGLLVCDFIDMRLDRHKRAVEKALRDALKKHKERARILRMSAFGLIEMTRQRQGPSFKRNIYSDCPHCRGAGVVKMPESVILDVMRIVQLAVHHEQVRKVTVGVSHDAAFRILNKKRAELHRIEEETGKTVIIRGETAFTSDQIEYVCEDDHGQPVTISATIQAPTRGGQ